MIFIINNCVRDCNYCKSSSPLKGLLLENWHECQIYYTYLFVFEICIFLSIMQLIKLLIINYIGGKSETFSRLDKLYSDLVMNICSIVDYVLQ